CHRGTPGPARQRRGASALPTADRGILARILRSRTTVLDTGPWRGVCWIGYRPTRGPTAGRARDGLDDTAGSRAALAVGGAQSTRAWYDGLVHEHGRHTLPRSQRRSPRL